MASDKTTPERNEEVDKTFAMHTAENSSLKASEQIPAAVLSCSRTATWFGRMMLFLVFPTIMGFLGLYIGYLETSRDGATRELSLDHDFGLPFALTLSICVVVGFQTRGFTSAEPTSWISWPKIKKRTKIVHKHVVRGQSTVDMYEGELTAVAEPKKKD